MENVWNNLCANFRGNWSRNTGFRAKKLKCQSEVQTALARKLTEGREKKFSNLEVAGNIVSSPTFKFFEFRHFFSVFFSMHQNFESTTAKNFEFEDLVILHMKLCTCVFICVRSRGLGQTRLKLVIVKFNIIDDFRLLCACAAVA